MTFIQSNCLLAEKYFLLEVEAGQSLKKRSIDWFRKIVFTLAP